MTTPEIYFLPRVAVSRCLLGDKVRYDGSSNVCPAILSGINRHYDMVPFCPEVAIGMGTPRPPIQLDLLGTEIRARRVGDVTKDYTDALKQYACKFLAANPELVAVINKRASPSCGHQSTKLYEYNMLIKNDATGIFINELIRLKPGLLIIDEVAFMDESKRLLFFKGI